MSARKESDKQWQLLTLLECKHLAICQQCIAGAHRVQTSFPLGLRMLRPGGSIPDLQHPFTHPFKEQERNKVFPTQHLPFKVHKENAHQKKNQIHHIIPIVGKVSQASPKQQANQTPCIIQSKNATASTCVPSYLVRSLASKKRQSCLLDFARPMQENPRYISHHADREMFAVVKCRLSLRGAARSVYTDALQKTNACSSPPSPLLTRPSSARSASKSH